MEKVSQRHVFTSFINLCISEFDKFYFFPFGLGRFGFAAFVVSVALIQNNIDSIRGMHKLKTCDNLRSRLIRTLSFAI